MIFKSHFKKQFLFPPTLFSFVTQCFSNYSHEPHPCNHSLSRLKAFVPIPNEPSFRDPEIVHLFCAKALKVAAVRAFLPEGKQLHAHLIKFGFCHVLSLRNQILSIYLKCKETKDALKLFDELPGRNVVSWNIVIHGIVGCGNENDLNPHLGFSYFKRMLFEKVAPDDITLNALIEEAFRIFNSMRSDGANGDEFTFSSLLSICDILEYYNFGKQVHSLILKLSFESDILVASALINMYAKNEDVIDAKRVFDKMAIRNVVAWNTMIFGCGNNGEVINVMKILRDMLFEGIFPDELTISSVLSSCGYASAITETQQVHALAVKLSFQEFVSVSNSLITAYSKCGNITNAFKCFRLMLEPDLVTYTSLINAYAFHGLGKEATEMFEKMISCGIKPDRISFLGILSACVHCGFVNTGLHYFKLMTDVYHIIPDSDHYTCLIDLLGRHGFVNEAFEFLKSIPIQAESNMLGAFIGSCKLHENIELAKSAAGKLFAIEPEKIVNYAVMANIYASHNHWLDAERVRKTMRDKNVAKFPGCSWIQVGNQVHSFVSSDKFELVSSLYLNLCSLSVVDDQFVLKVGMTFTTLEDAGKFYRNYAKVADLYADRHIWVPIYLDHHFIL
ncbi:hypothetical protein Ahy_A02g009051 [Arachis hypogaea]|uniref:Pentatricopeptide repeat-containing protein n=1 Tax=Arachis hypogaea TaxID=3818 RepID=A0A445EFZ4_ARAHY|nr:hypothetical protein Ahy_A02g009051 [Arachis hypogaea]